VFVRDRNTGTTSRVSVSTTGDIGTDGGVDPAITPDGRFVVFASTSANLVGGDTNGQYDVFVRDRTLGTTERVSLLSDGSQATGGESRRPSISDDGRYVVFESRATNLPGTNPSGVFLFDRVTDQLTAVDKPGSPLDNKSLPAISGDGRWVVMVGRDPTIQVHTDIWVWDRTGQEAIRAIVHEDTVDGQFPNQSSTDPAISSDGRFVTYRTHAGNILKPGTTAGSAPRLMRWDRRLADDPCSSEKGAQYIAQNTFRSSLDATGKVVALEHNFGQLVPGEPFNTITRAYAWDASADAEPVVTCQTFGPGASEVLDANPCHQHRTTNPINTATGAESLSESDLRMAAPGVAFDFTRSYTSLDDTVTVLGRGWTHPYLASLAIDADGDVSVTSDNGQRGWYDRQTDGSFLAPAGVRAHLTQDATGYTLETRAHRVTRFDLQGRLTEMSVRGQGLTFAYSGSNLTTVTDAAGRAVSLTYAGSRLSRVTLPDGRYVEYTFDGQGRLQTVRDARGGITTYAYDAGSRVASELDPNGHYRFRNTYDAATGRVVSQLDAKGNQTTFAWNQNTQTATVTHPGGAVWRYEYSGNILAARVDPLNRRTEYRYDGRLNCTQVTDPRGNIVAKQYDTRGNLTRVTSPAPVLAEEVRTYDTDDNLLSVTDPRGKTTTFEYDALDRVVEITDPAGKTTAFTYNARSQVATITDVRGKVTSYGYDAEGNLTSLVTPLGKTTTMGYDASGRMIWRTDPRGNTGGANPENFRTHLTYNGFDQPVTVTDPLDHVTTHGYDPVGNRTAVTDARNKTTTFGYDELDRLVTTTDPRNGVETLAYDVRGNLVSRASPTNDTTTYGYDLADQRTAMTMPRGNVAGATAEDFTWHYAYDPAGNLTTVTDPADKVTTTTFDNLDRLTAVTDPLNHTTTSVYDAAGNVTSRTDAVGNTTTFSYDDLGRLATVTSPRGNVSGATPTDYQTRFVYDEAGNRTEVIAPRGGRTTWSFDDDSRMVAQVDPRGYVLPALPAQYTTVYAYDDASNLTRVTDPLGNQTNYVFDAANRQTSVTDANIRVTLYGYDEVNRLTSVTGPDAPACTGTPQCFAGKAASVYSHDDTDNLTRTLDPKNHATDFDYDLAGRLTKRTDPLGRFATYTYDPDSNLATHTTARGNASGTPATGRITYGYDRLGRPTLIDHGDATPDVTYSYDDAGRRTSMIDGAGTVSYGYDNADRPTAITRSGGDAWAYGYDPDGNVTSRTYPDSTLVSAMFDRDGNLATVTQGSQTTSFAYDPAGRLSTTTLPSGNGHVESRTYDAAGRLTVVGNQKGATVLSRFTRTLDPVGNPTQVATLRGATTTYEAMEYDPANRLTKWCRAASCAGAAAWISYAYDPVGNRTQQVRTSVAPNGTTTYTYDNADQLTQTVAGSTTTSFTYDADGNQTAIGTRTFAYDLADRVKSTTFGSTTTNYTFDGNGLRVTRATGATINTRYSWDTLGELPELALERNASNALIRRYVQGPTGPLSMATSATATFWFHRDHLGSITDLTNNTGSWQWRYDYEPFGTQLTATKVNNQAPTNLTRFAGEYLDTEWANYHVRARQMDPATGRFLARDPIDPPLTDQAVSRYAYVNNRPGVHTDPSGLTVAAPAGLPKLPPLPPGVAIPDFVPPEWEKPPTTKPPTPTGPPAAPVAPWIVRAAPAIGIGSVVAVGGGVILGVQAWAYEGANEAEEQRTRREEASEERALDLSFAIDKLKNDECDCNPFAIRFSQSSVSPTFRDGGTIEGTADELRGGRTQPRDVPSIRIFRRNGRWFTLDNRRLVAFQMAGKAIPCKLATTEEVASEAWKLTTRTEGTSIRIGGGKTWTP